MNNILSNREYLIEGNCFAPSRYLLKNFMSVIDVYLIDTTSSAGDWSGLIFQKLKNATIDEDHTLNEYRVVKVSESYLEKIAKRIFS